MQLFQLCSVFKILEALAMADHPSDITSQHSPWPTQLQRSCLLAVPEYRNNPTTGTGSMSLPQMPEGSPLHASAKGPGERPPQTTLYDTAPSTAPPKHLPPPSAAQACLSSPPPSNPPAWNGDSIKSMVLFCSLLFPRHLEQALACPGNKSWLRELRR